ncbi:MAG: hypothetical protein CM1200mP23_3010 [Nitrososphaerota archaeon]|nr:MAG: hypothetical protein CM1200mP23_3010 [Nitrososphaerota archaeon]
MEFKVTNPNFKSVMLQLIKYSIYHDDELIEVGEIGQDQKVALLRQLILSYLMKDHL